MRAWLFVLLVAGCGGSGPVCGNGVVESGEQCDQGLLNGTPGVACSSDCKSISVPKVQLNITWSLMGNLNPSVPGYMGAGCSDFGATKMHLVLTGPTDADGFDTILPCDRHNQMYPDPKICPKVDTAGRCAPLTAGMYQATGTLERDDGTAITMSNSTLKTDAQAVLGAPVNLPVDFEPIDILSGQDLKGNFLFHVGWGDRGVKCADAKVTTEAIVLVDSQGKPVPGMTKDGLKLDGTAGACYTPKDSILNTPQEIDGLTWGRYHIAIYSGSKSLCGSQPIFVNPGTNPFTYDLVAAAQIPAGDGGVAADGGANTCP